MPTFFEIGESLQAISDLLEERGGDVSDPEVAAALDGWFAEAAADEGRKLDAVYGLIRTLEARAAVARSEADEYARRARADANAVERLKARVLGHLQVTRRAKATSATGRVFAVQANSSVPVVLIEEDPQRVPARFRRVTVSIDRKGVADALADGETLDFARLGERGFHLRVR